MFAGSPGRILSAGDGIRILASSREPLRVAGEAVYQLAGLEVPGPRQAVDPDAAARTASVRLFLARAAGAAPQLAFTPAQASVVAAICRRLDGIPLAIELAARRAAVFGVRDTAVRLASHLDLQKLGRRTANRRHQTLRAALDWSHDLLSEIERAVLRSVAIFVGRFTLEAALAVAGQEDTSRPDATDAVGSLV